MTKILKKLLRLYYGLLWPAEKAWCAAACAGMLAAAGRFLRSKGLIGTDADLPALGEKWASYVQERFDPAAPEKFYGAWTGEMGASNIVANINDQFSRPYLAALLTKHLAAGGAFGGLLLDFGCGTAALSVAWRDAYAGGCELRLSDVDNLAREFTAALAEGRKGVLLEDTGLKGIADGSVDAVICVHVLEHVKDPVGIFELLGRKLKPGGLLFLEAPWGGHKEHIKEAEEGWRDKNGAGLLAKDYVLVARMNALIHLRGGISSLYRKRAG